MTVDTQLLCGIRLFEPEKVKGMENQPRFALISDIDNLTVALQDFVRPPSDNPSVAASALSGVRLEVTKV